MPEEGGLRLWDTSPPSLLLLLARSSRDGLLLAPPILCDLDGLLMLPVCGLVMLLVLFDLLATEAIVAGLL